MSAIERGVMSNNAIRRLNELEEQQLDYEKKIAIEKSKTVDLIPKAEIANYYKSALKLEPLLLINYLVDEIILYNDRIEIRFTSPITKSPDDCQSFYYTQIQRRFRVMKKSRAYLSTSLFIAS